MASERAGGLRTCEATLFQFFHHDIAILSLTGVGLALVSMTGLFFLYPTLFKVSLVLSN